MECLCQSDEYHHEIGCFFKYVIFLLKHFVSSLDLLSSDPNDEHKEPLKNKIWIQIASQYDGYFTDCEMDTDCADGCELKFLQKSAEKHLKLLANGKHGNADGASELNANTGCFAEQSSNSSCKVPDLTHISFLLELIVANPVLFDQMHPSFGDDAFKLRIWNEICTTWYKKEQIYCTDFKFQCRFSEQMLYRISNPLNVNAKNDIANGHDGLSDDASVFADKTIPRLICDMVGDGTKAATVHIKNVEKMYIIANTKKFDVATPLDDTPPPPSEQPMKRTKRWRKNRNKSTGHQQHMDELPLLNQNN